LQPPPGFAPLVRGAQPLTGKGWRLPTAEMSTVMVEGPFSGIGRGLYSPETLISTGDLPLSRRTASLLVTLKREGENSEDPAMVGAYLPILPPKD